MVLLLVVLVLMTVVVVMKMLLSVVEFVVFVVVVVGGSICSGVYGCVVSVATAPAAVALSLLLVTCHFDYFFVDCPNLLLEQDGIFICYWVIQKYSRFDQAHNLCKAQSGHMAIVDTSAKVKHIKDNNLLESTGTKK